MEEVNGMKEIKAIAAFMDHKLGFVGIGEVKAVADADAKRIVGQGLAVEVETERPRRRTRKASTPPTPGRK